jgi:epoxide hydrolase-like predicted phosphatase
VTTPRRESTGLHGLVVDWGGVLTTDVRVAVGAWAQSEGVPVDDVRSAFQRWLGPAEAEREIANPVHLLERGELESTQFEQFLADQLATADGHAVEPAGLLRRMFAHFTRAPAMSALVWRAREAGITTGLLSNSWGNSYPDDVFDGMFDTVVISGEVGMRKPEQRIYSYTCERLGLRPDECVFVDDLPHNVTAAVAAGMVGVHHTSYASTEAELSALFGHDLSARADVG